MPMNSVICHGFCERTKKFTPNCYTVLLGFIFLGGVARHVGSCLASLTDPDDLSIRISLAMSELAGGTEQGPATWPRKQSHFLFQKSR